MRISEEYLKATETPMKSEHYELRDKEPTMPAPQRYKLLKDLPGYKAGTVFAVTEDGELLENDTTHYAWGYAEMLMKAHLDPYCTIDTSDWFTPIDPDGQQGGRWRAGDGRQYWYVLLSDEPVITSATEDYTRFDGTRHKSGNYFRTREQAEAAAEAIRAVLAYIQTPWLPNAARSGELLKESSIRATVIDELDKARRAVQNTNDKETNK